MRKYKSTILTTILIGLFLNVMGQTKFISSKYPYSFTIPEGWRIKDKIYLPETDAKIVDDRGNSFIVTVKQLPNELKGMSIDNLFNASTDEEIKMSLSPMGFENIRLTKRGTTYIGGKLFYYVFSNEPFPDGLRLNHKLFYTIYQSKVYTIDCASISSMSVEVAPYLEIMLQTVKFK